ncbi:hypothetical protein BH09MYX1_BH09MYX1_42810 [soil metagenome]
MRRIVLLGLLTLAVACDDKDTAKGTQPSAQTATTVAPPPPPPPAKPPIVFVEDAATSVSGERIDPSGDAKGRLVAILASKPKVAGETIEVQALRDVKFPRVAAVIAALREAKASGAVIKTALRDNSLGELTIDFAPPIACSPVGMIAKDSAILVWPAGGGTATRFTHGMAGPDMTLGSDGMRKLGATCDSNLFAIAGDESVKWGLVYDLAISTRSNEAGIAKQTVAVVPADPPVPGRKL